MSIEGIGRGQAWSGDDVATGGLRKESQRDEQKKIDETPKPQLLAFVQGCFILAETAKNASGAVNPNATNTAGVTARLLANQRRQAGVYDQEIISQINRQGGTKIYFKHSTTKCNAAIAWMRDVLLPYLDKMWYMEPMPVPKLSPELEGSIINNTMLAIAADLQNGYMPPTPGEVSDYALSKKQETEHLINEEARRRTKAMEKVIRDQLQEADFKNILNHFLEYLVIYGTSIIKAPVIYHQKKLQWMGTKPIVTDVMSPMIEVVSPFNFYPAPEMVDVKEKGYVIERMFWYRQDLERFKGVPNYYDNEIDAVLKDYPQGNVTIRPYDQEKRVLEEKMNSTPANDTRLEVYDYWGPIRGDLLKSWGIKVENEYTDYDYEVIWCGSHIIKAMPNPSPTGEKPYYKSTFKRILGSFWGWGVPDLMCDSQDIANGAVRATVNNMAICSGPQVVVDRSRMAEGEQIDALYPWRIWLTKNPGGGTASPVTFYQPDSNLGDLLTLLNTVIRISDDQTGIPAYAYGSDLAAGAGRTATGLSMLMNAASRGLKDTFIEIDSKVIEPLIKAYFIWNMLYNPDESIKGDARVVVRGSTDIIYKEMQTVRLAEMIDRVSNPVAMNLVGVDGYLNLLREYVTAINLDPDQFLPTKEQLDQKLRIAQIQQQQQQAQGLPPPGGGGEAPQQGGQNSSGTQSRETSALNKPSQEGAL